MFISLLDFEMIIVIYDLSYLTAGNIAHLI